MMQFTERDLGGYFTVPELRDTGADMDKIRPELIRALVQFRLLIGRPVVLASGGLTSGEHEPNSWHYQGMAVDFTLPNNGSSLDHVVAVMLEAGFKGIGCYWNQVANSFHGDVRPIVTLWSGIKPAPGAGPWTYGPLIRL